MERSTEGHPIRGALRFVDMPSPSSVGAGFRRRSPGHSTELGIWDESRSPLRTRRLPAESRAAMITSSMRILVLGATGFLGGYLRDALSRDHVVVGSHPDRGRRDS